MVGDFNVVQDQNLDTFNHHHVNNPKAKERILTIKDELNLIDPYRELHEFEKSFTWRRPHPLKQARIDYFLVSENLYQVYKVISSYLVTDQTIQLLFYLSE